MCEKGAIDGDVDHQLLANYRDRLLCEQWPNGVGGGRKGSKAGTPKGSPANRVADRRREFAFKGRAISFNGGLANVGQMVVQPPAGGGGAKPSSGASTTSSSGYSSEGVQQPTGARSRAASWLRQRAHSVRIFWSIQPQFIPSFPLKRSEVVRRVAAPAMPSSGSSSWAKC
jgi:hypothetical protein